MEREDGGREKQKSRGRMEHVQEMDRIGKRKARREGWCDDRAAGPVFVHASAGKLITKWALTPLKC